MSFTLIGLMSGSSLDGVDLASCTFSDTNGKWSFTIDAAETTPYDAEWRERLAGASGSTAAEYAKLHVDYGHYLGMLLRRFIRTHDLKPDGIASHGHTVFHQPDRHFTAQIGCGETMVSYLSVPLVTNFRARDVALGGQGAPLVPFGEQQLFAQTKLFLNLGGIANLTVFAEGSELQGLTWLKGSPRHLAYDICPCNQLLNRLAVQVQPGANYDAEGKFAAGGKVLPDLLTQLSELNYYQLLPPRSLGNEWIAAEAWPLIDTYKASPQDKLHTCCVHIAQQLGRELARLNRWGGSLLITGGGAHNTFLMSQIESVLADRGIFMLAAEPQLADYKEAMIFAFLGLNTLLRRPNVLNDATGAKQAVIAGEVHFPDQGGFSLILER